MAITKVTNAVIKDGTVTSTNLAMGVAASQDNVAVLGFKIASADSLAIYGMKDGFVDDYQDATGVDASASTNATRNASAIFRAKTTDGQSFRKRRNVARKNAIRVAKRAENDGTTTSGF